MITAQGMTDRVARQNPVLSRCQVAEAIAIWIGNDELEVTVNKDGEIWYAINTRQTGQRAG